MEKHEAGRSIVRLAWLVAAVLLVVLATLLLVRAERERHDAARAAERVEVQDRVVELAARLQAEVDRNVQRTQGIVAVLSFDPGMDQERFSRLGEQVLRGAHEIVRISAAPNLVIRRVYPIRGDEGLVGLDYRTIPDRLPLLLQARDTGEPVLAGPMELLQRPGEGLIAYSPVYVDDGPDRSQRFWGVVSTVIDPGRLFAAAGLRDPALGLDLALSGRHGQPGGPPFFGDPAVIESDPVTARVELPSGSWQLAAVPRGGWTAPDTPWAMRGLFGVGTLLVVAPIIGLGRAAELRRRRRGQSREREAELARLSWRFEFALMAAEFGVWDVDLATDELIWDDRVRTLFGYPERDGFFSEAEWAGALHPDDRERALAEAREAVNGNGRFVSAYRIVRPDGAVRHIRDLASVYEAPDGTRRLVGLLWDATEDVARQEELNLRRIEAEAATVAKSRFLAAMSHEIRTPMSGVLGLLGLMLDEPLPPKQRERAEIALASAQGLLQILNDILDFSKLEANLIRFADEDVEVRPLVDEVMALMAAGAAQKGIDLRCEVSVATPERIVTDAMRLRQVLTNLLSNAAKFTERGAVSVRVGYVPEGEEGELRVEVEDTGIGIAEDQLDNVFEQFVQVDNSLTRKTGGTGLGLSISKQLVELMGGRIGVESRPGVGSTFRFAIRVKADAGEAVPVRARLPAVELPSKGRPLRILLAEDNLTNQYLIRAFLQGQEHDLVTVGNGAMAVEAVAGGDFDVVLMDVQMPVLDGMAASRAIRSLPGAAGRVHIIALTANAMSGDREQCIAAGMDDYLSKPVEAAALTQALARVPAAAEASAPQVRAAS